MVSKKVRGILTKKGPFQLAVYHFLNQHIGPNKQYSLGFGFPNKRAFSVGLKQNLYCAVDKIMEISWPCTQSLSPPGFSIEKIDTTSTNLTSTLAEINTLWQCMKKDVANVAIGYRDSTWIKHRYIDKPFADYLLYFVRNKTALGLIVLKQHANNETELLDIIAPRDQAYTLIEAAKHIAASSKSARLYAWCTPSSLLWLQQTEPTISNLTKSAPTVKETDIIIPGCNANNPEHALRVKDKWWLLGGDTDFR
jgi:hypothetical protein